MHLTSSPLISRVSGSTPLDSSADDRILRTLMEADAPVRILLLDHLCDGDEGRRQRLVGMVEAALQWRTQDAGLRWG